MKQIAISVKKYIFYFLLFTGLLILIELSYLAEDYFLDLLSRQKLGAFLKDNLARYLGFTFAVLPIFLIEKILPNDEASKDHSNGLLFWAIALQASYFVSFLTIEIIHYFNIKPFINLSFEDISKSSFLSPLLLNIFLIVFSLLVFDFFYYWYHRIQHTIPFFWEIHKTHHSIKNLNAVVSYHHILEEVFRIPFILIPLAILIQIDTPKLAILSSFYAAYGWFIHMNSKISLGPLRYLFTDNYYHRIHHSVEPHHHNKNYAAFFPIWDILFRSVHFPKFNEFPKVGLDYMEQPKTLKEYFFSPNIFGKKKQFTSTKK